METGPVQLKTEPTYLKIHVLGEHMLKEPFLINIFYEHIHLVCGTYETY